MKFSVFSVCMPEYDILETVAAIRQMGYDAVEWRVANPPAEEKPEDYTFERRYWSYNKSNVDVNRIEEMAPWLREVCDKHGLEIFSFSTYLGLWDIKTAEKVMRAAGSINCRNIRINAPLYDGKENYRKLFDRVSIQLKDIEQLAKTYDVKINMEMHLGTIIPSASSAYRLIKVCDPQYTGIIYDIGNLVYEGFENYKMGLELLGEYLSYIHIKNAAWFKTSTGEGELGAWKVVQAPLRKGVADVKNFFSIIRELKYDGYISVEDFSNETDTIGKLTDDLAYLKEITQSHC